MTDAVRCVVRDSKQNAEDVPRPAAAPTNDVRRWWYTWVTALALTVTPTVCHAQSTVMQSASGKLSLSQAVAKALQHNFDVQTARFTVDSAKAERRIARAIPNPSYVASPNTPYQYGASITLDVGPQRVYRTRTAALGAAAADIDTHDVARTVTLSVQHAFYDVLLSDAMREQMQLRHAALQQIYQADSVRVLAGDIPERALARSAVELARTDVDLARTINDAQNARFALQVLLGNDGADTALVVDGTLEYHRSEMPSLDSMLTLAARGRPDLQAAELRIDQGRARQSLATSSLVPLPSLSYVRQFGAPFETGHYYSFGIALELPLLNNYRGQRERAQSALSIAALTRDRLAGQVQRDVVGARNNLLTQRAALERLSDGLRDAVQRNVTAARYAYERGATSLLDVLDAVRAEQEFHGAQLQAIHDYWISLFALNAAVGTSVVRTP